MDLSNKWVSFDHPPLNPLPSREGNLYQDGLVNCV